MRMGKGKRKKQNRKKESGLKKYKKERKKED